MQAPREDKSDDSKYSFYEELEQVFHHFPQYHMKILLRDFNAKVGRENIFKPTTGNDSLHQDSNDNGVRTVHSATLTIYYLKAQCPHAETFISTPGTLLMGRLTIRLITY